MAKYKVKAGKEGYINDRMEKDGAVFEAREGLKGSWFDAVPEAVVELPVGDFDVPPNPPDQTAEEIAAADAEKDAQAAAEQSVEQQAAAQEAAVAESGDGTHTAEKAAAELDDDVETL